MEVIENAYETPAVTVMDVTFEGVICQSPGGMGGRNPYVPTDENPFGN